MNSPLITAIVPTYRRPNLLKRAISSVLRQTFKDLQVCIYDNASGDETARVVAEFAQQDSRVKYHCHPKNIGANQNFNYGLTSVNTPYFSFLSDDDILLPDFYSTAFSYLQKLPDVGFFVGSAIVMTNRGEVLSVPLDSWPKEGYFSHPDGLLHMIENKLPAWTAILFRKMFTDSIGALDYAVGGSIDLDYQLRMACKYPFVTSRKPCGILTIHAHSISGAPSIETFWPGWLKLIQNVTTASELPEKIRIRAQYGLTLSIKKILFSTGLKCIRNKDTTDGHLIANVLREHFGEKWRPFVLTLTAKFCKMGMLPKRCFTFSYDLVRFIHRKMILNSERLQGKYGHYAKWLYTVDEPSAKNP